MTNKNWDSFKSSFEQFIVGDIRKSLAANIEVGTIILTVIGIECISGYFTGKESSPETFINFIQTFMPDYAEVAEAIYKCVRNGLAHDYIIKEHGGLSFMFTRKIGEPHLVASETNPNCFYLNREQFAKDFLEAQHKYFKQVEVDQELSRRANKRLKKKSFLTVFSFSQPIQFVSLDENRDEFEYTGSTGTAGRPPF